MSIKGFKFPFSVGPTSFPAEAAGDDVIRSSIIQILSTGYGERVMRPEFGCNAFSYVFENDDDILRVLIEREVRSSLARWEPRIVVDGVVVESSDPANVGLITITVYYTVLSTNQVTSITIAGGT